MSVIQQKRSAWLLLSLALACGQSDATPGGSTPVAASHGVIRADGLDVAPGAEGSGNSMESIGSSRTPRMRTPTLTERAPQPAPAGSAQPAPTFIMPYPRGAWRLAMPAALDNVVLWFDQILIRHDGARDEVSFNLAYWFSVPAAPRHTRDEALALARDVAAEAARAPDEFGELARRYSEDLPRRDEGGELGGLSATQVSSWPQVLDALAALSPGQTSEVVETRYGFHILRRREPPAEQTLSGTHLVIGHDQAEWLKMQARGPLPSRSRDEALALATDLYRRALAQPELFQELVGRHSEHRDAVMGGDFGSWSTREPNPFPPRLRRLKQLAVGEVGAPIETHLGFEIIRRTEARARPQYAAWVGQLAFDPTAADGAEDSRARVLARAEALARSCAAEPQRLGAAGELQLRRQQWQSGRGSPAMEAALEKLELGAVSASPVQAESAFQIFQRIAPEPVQPVQYVTELPAPVHPDLHFHLAQLQPESLRDILRDSGRIAEPRLELTGDELAQLQSLHGVLPIADTSDYLATTAAIQRVLDQTGTLLGPQRYELYLAVLEHLLSSAILGAPADSRAERGI